MTPFLKIITEYCAQYVNDQNLIGLASEDMPLYARRMWGFFQAGIPYFTIPAEMQNYLLGTEENPNITLPKYDSLIKTVVAELTQDTVVDLGEGFIGYELFCCRVRNTDDFGNIYYTAAPNVEYDSAAGTITIHATAENPVPQGTQYEIDFYTDGNFSHTLNAEQMKILGYCFQVVWQTNFNNDYISNVAMIEDRSFGVQNKANKMNADTARLREVRNQLYDEMRRYEQNLFYKKTFPQGLNIL